MSRKRIAPAIANASQGNRKTSPAPEAEAEAASERFRTTRVAGFTTTLQLVTARGRDVVVSATRIDEATDLHIIEHLDFEPAIPCGCWDYPDDDERCPRTADMIVEQNGCPECGNNDPIRWMCSDACWVEMAEVGTECSVCGYEASRDEALWIVGRLS